MTQPARSRLARSRPAIAALPASHARLTPAVTPPAEDGSAGGIARATRRDGSPSWHVELHRGGRRMHMHFADHSFGSEAAALAVARAWRDAVLTFVPALLQGGQATRRTRQQAAGLPGLSYVKPGHHRSAFWMGRLVCPGKQPRTRRFSTAQHGEAEAKAMAEAWLFAELALLEGAHATSSGLPTPAPEPASIGGEARYGITRLISPKGRAQWQVMVVRSGHRMQAGFPDLTYGSEAAALAVARAWRGAVMAAVPPLTNIEMRQIVRKIRHDGTPGVTFNAKRQIWSAFVTLPGPRQIKHSFKVSVHGEDQARALAEAERLHMLDALENGRDPALRSPAALAAAKRDFQSRPSAPRPVRRTAAG